MSTVYKIKCNDCTAVYIGQTSRAELKNILKPPRVLTKTLNWPNILKKLATALILKRVSSSLLSPVEPAIVFGSVVFQ